MNFIRRLRKFSQSGVFSSGENLRNLRINLS